MMLAAGATDSSRQRIRRQQPAQQTAAVNCDYAVLAFLAFVFVAAPMRASRRGLRPPLVARCGGYFF